jgi:hypothetical protein
MTIREFFKNDRYAAFSGVELLEVEPGFERRTNETLMIRLKNRNRGRTGAMQTKNIDFQPSIHMIALVLLIFA